MKFSTGASCCSLVLLIGPLFACTAFVVTHQQQPRSISKSLLAATVEQSATTPSTSSIQLIPPPSIQDLMSTKDGTAHLYEERVQKTYGRFPLTIASGKGCRLYTTDGKDYLDFVSGIATCALGHSNEALTAAVTAQISQVHHVSNLYLIPAQAALAEWLTSNSVADKVFFCNSGAEANEAAIKCARRHASNRGITKPVIITAQNSFHGRTLAALSATGQMKYHKGFGYDGKMVPGFQFVPYNDAAALENAVRSLDTANGEGLAAIMMEALQGEGGIRPGTDEFFLKVRSLCDETGALMICDEVQVGMGRSGTLWGYQHLPVTPDIFTSAKALGGGVPIGAMMAAGVAANVFGPGDHASTYGGNPLACAAGLAVAKYFSDHNILDNVQARGEQLATGLAVIQAKYPSILGDIRGWGLIRGIEVIASGMTPVTLVSAAMEQGLLLVGAGSNVVRFVPPLIVTAAEVDEALSKFELAVAKVAADAQQVTP